MKTTLFYFLIELPEAGMAITWIGGGLKPSNHPEHVWLTTPGGSPVLEVPRAHVHPTNKQELAQRILADRMADKAPMN
jgi:hypothetical protein